MRRTSVAVLLCMYSIGVGVVALRGKTLTAEQITQSRGRAALIASDFELKKNRHGLIEISFFAVTRDRNPSKLSPEKLKPGDILVFNDDQSFFAAVASHFAAFDEPHRYTGSTMFSFLPFSKSKVEVIALGSDARGAVLFEGRVNIVYIEVGKKGNVIRVPTKPWPSQPAKK
jgi:hypothetical protein